MKPASEVGINEAVGDTNDLDHFGDIVDAYDVRAVENGHSDCGGGAPNAVLRWSGFSVAGESCAEKALARSADEQRVAELGQTGKLFEQFVILREALAEADAGIKDDLRFEDASLACNRDGFAQTANHVPQNVPREFAFLHGARLTAHVHHDEGHTAARSDFGNTRIILQPGNIVNDFRARVECRFGHFKLLRVDGDRDFQPVTKAVQNRKDAREFFFGRRAGGAGTGGFAPHIEQISTRGFHGQRVLDGVLSVKELAAIGKTVWGNVQHAHDERAFAKRKCA